MKQVLPVVLALNFVSTHLAAAISISGPITVADVENVDAQPAVATDGQGAVIVWTTAGEIRSARFESSGTLTSGVLSVGSSGSLPYFPKSGPKPRIAFGAGRYLVVWVVRTADQSLLTGRFVFADGFPDGDPFVVDAAGSGMIDAADVAWTGADFVIAWSGNAGGVAHASLLGEVHSVNRPSKLKQSWSRVAVEPIGAAPLLVWSRKINGGNTTTIEASFEDQLDEVVELARQNVVVGAGNGGLLFVRDPRAACGNGKCLVTWTRENGPGRGSEGYAAEIDSSGSVAAAAGRIVRGGDLTSNVELLPMFDGERFRIISNSVFQVKERIVTTTDLTQSPALALFDAPDAPGQYDVVRFSDVSNFRDVHFLVWVQQNPPIPRLVLRIMRDDQLRRRPVRR